ncbi:MAG: hypothetical protein GZ085_05940 [Sulfuriferula multivorans]|uniref:YqjK-like family protein n=1 Tax=Sulfuriferula multivorans TaxID=1559896 RepID=A0A7C9NTS7_9PROT|nr:hypothetical protein [Sulfuriferula multivorans]
MSSKLTQLVERRQQLVAQASAQRTTLAYTLEPWRARLSLVDRGVAVLGYVRRHPILMVGASLLLAALRPRRVGKWLQHGLIAWQLGRRLRRH